MKRKYLLALTLVFLLLTTGAIYFFTLAEYAVKRNVIVTCRYMGYACGDCYPQYNVNEVLPSSLKKKLIAKDIDIEFESDKQEEEFTKKISSCSICYIYNFKGDLYYSEKEDCYVVKLRDYSLKVKDGKCCEQ